MAELLPRAARALVSSSGGIAVREYRPAALGPLDVRVAIAFAGICGSDLHLIDSPDTHRSVLEGAEVVPGHEQSGVIVEIGDGVTGLSVDHEVCVLPRTPCGRCRMCRVGSSTRCTSFLRPVGGGWSTEMVVDQRLVERIPSGLALDMAALSEPTACVLRAIDRAGIRPGSTALIVGAGPMGLLLSCLLPRCGVATVLVSEPSPERRRLAESFGAVVFDPRGSDLAAWVRSETRGRGVDYAFEAVGSASALEDAIDATDVGGTVIVVGVANPAARAQVSPHAIFAKELTIVGAWGVETTFTRAMGLLSTLNPRDLITDRFGLDDVEAAIGLARRGAAGKVLLAPGLERK
ncbi:zinc-dependent alcohol dehydrogenase [Marisediminicola antarctica]|nr:zinc-binding dehydrogenase [Marisediminicola antarctica]